MHAERAAWASASAASFQAASALVNLALSRRYGVSGYPVNPVVSFRLNVVGGGRSG